MSIKYIESIVLIICLGRVAELKVRAIEPHSISGIQAGSNGVVTLKFAGETSPLFAPYYDMYPLEASPDLVQWSPLSLVQRTNAAPDALSFLDTNAPRFTQRFYRTPAIQLPTPDVAPTGPHAVGTFSMLLTNPLRSNAKFMVTFWYPAAPRAGTLPAAYMEPQIPLSDRYYDFSSRGGPNFDPQVQAFFSHSFSDAPIAANQSCPVVLYDPGSGQHRRQNTDETEDLASWGYIVVGLDASDTTISVFPDGTVVYGGPEADNDAAVESRLLDLRYVLDELGSLNADEPRLSGRLDLSRIGAFGWSLGGMATAQLCLLDSRCKAGAGLDGWFAQTNQLEQPMGVPFLFLRSDYGPGPGSFYFTLAPAGLTFDCLELYNEQTNDAYWVKLLSTDHACFSEYRVIADARSLESVWGVPTSLQVLPPARISQIIRTYLLSFFNKSLNGEDDHLLDGPSPAYPEAIQFLSKHGPSSAPQYPLAGLAAASDGNFYGTTAYGGASGYGTVVKVTPNGALTTLVSFTGANGSYPLAGLVEGTDGNFYGATEFGGANGNKGTVFQVTPAGVLTVLISFNGADGSYPSVSLTQGNDGNFYGATRFGGTSRNNGTVFQVTPAGALTTLVTFNGVNGSGPNGLIQGGDGNFYGTTIGSSANHYGTIFKMTPAGTLTTLALLNGYNGENPTGGLIQGSDGNLYGTAVYGGNFGVYGLLKEGIGGGGTVFKISPTGAVTTLFMFDGANGYNPCSALAQGGDGNFYGTTDGGGASGNGTVFKISPAGVFTTLVSFNGANGSRPYAGLAQGKDGNFYGTTEFGGANNDGTVFQVTTNGVVTTLAVFGGEIKGAAAFTPRK